ncbi:hypothetical protein ACKKBF_B11260 [Auxenochlorella protothecoides x Auxenochlorella symbiontica]
MQDPVVLGDTGNTYERSTISMWLERCARAGRAATDPLTGLVVGDAPKLIPNHTLKSLIQGWASRHYIVDLGRFSKARRTKRATPSKQPATEAAIGTSGSPSTTPASPRIAEHQGSDSPTHRLEGGASRSEGHHAEPPALPPPSPARPLYPDPGDPASARLGLDGVPEALAALHPSRLAAGGYPAQAKAAYAARTLSTLASQREAQDAMMEHQAVPLALVLLGRRLAPADATPHLLRILQRLAAWRGDVAQEIVACGGILTAASLLSEPAPEVRAAAASLLYFLVQQQPGRGRQAALDALAGQAARGRMPPRPLMAFWRWHRPVPGAEAGAGPEGETEAGASAGALAAADASLACLVHALVSGDVGFCRADALDARDTAVPAALARALLAAGPRGDAATSCAAEEALAGLAEHAPAGLASLVTAALEAGAGSAARGAAAEAAAWPYAAAADAAAVPEAAAAFGASAPSEAVEQLAGLCRGLWLLCAARGTDPAAVRAACHASPHFPEFVRGVLRCAALDPGSPLLPRLLGWLGALCHEPRSPSASLAAATEGVRAALATVLPDLLPALLREVEAGTASPPGKRCWWWLGGSLRRAELACTLTCNLAASRGGAGLGPSSAEAPAGPSGRWGGRLQEGLTAMLRGTGQDPRVLLAAALCTLLCAALGALDRANAALAAGLAAAARAPPRAGAGPSGAPPAAPAGPGEVAAAALSALVAATCAACNLAASPSAARAVRAHAAGARGAHGAASGEDLVATLRTLLGDRGLAPACRDAARRLLLDAEGSAAGGSRPVQCITAQLPQRRMVFPQP